MSLQEEQRAFYESCMNGDEGTRRAYHNEYYAQTYGALRGHVDYLVNELDELELGLEIQAKQGQDADRHPRLPLILRHNQFVSDTLDLVQKNLDNTMLA